MLIFKKEKQVVELALNHTKITGECLDIMTRAVRKFITEMDGQLAESARQVNELETEADKALRDIRELLYSGAYLPTIRGDIYRLLSAVDDVANKVENCLDFVNYQRPASAGRYAQELTEILDLTLSCYESLALAMRAFFKPKGQVEELREQARNVGKTESEIDARERALTAKIFESDLSLAEKQHTVQLLEKLTRISDRLENTADELQLLSLKSII